MTYEIYKLLHVLGIVLVFMALGAQVFHKASKKVRHLIMGTHGVGVLLLLVAGFGMLARTGGMANGLPGWLHPKLLVWVLIAAAPALLSRKPEWGKIIWAVLPILALVAAYFGINH